MGVMQDTASIFFWEDHAFGRSKLMEATLPNTAVQVLSVEISSE